MAKKPEREVLNMERVYVTKILSEESGTNTRGDKISVRILILYSNFTYEYVDLDGGWYKKPNDEKTDLSRGYECKDFIKHLDYQKCRYKKMTREEALSYLKEKEKEFQTFEGAVHAIWTREEEKKRWRSVFAPRAYDDGDRPENHYKKDES